jgi:hypothetical protein
MPHKVITGTPETVEDYINGRFVGNPVPAQDLAVGGLTLIFTTPALTVTFTAGNKTLAQVVAEINAAAAATIAALRFADQGPHMTNRPGDTKVVAQQRLVLFRDAGLTLADTGTANVLLGINLTAPFISAGIIPQAKLAGFTQGPAPGQLCLIIAP